MTLTPNALQAIHGQRLEAKAAADLLGLCQGLLADRNINAAEAVHLDAWLRQHAAALDGDPDGIDLLDLTGQILADGIVTAAELSDLKALLRCIIEHRANGHELGQRLAGIVRGIVADGALLDAEIKALQRWMDAAARRSTDPLLALLKQRVTDVLADGIVTDEERAQLWQILTDYIGTDPAAMGAIDGLASRLPCEPLDAMPVAAHRYCFTGDFAFGPRLACIAAVEQHGGIAVSGVSRKLHYLVIGRYASPYWVGSQHGLKISRALELRQAGHPVHIIAEETWARLLP